MAFKRGDRVEISSKEVGFLGSFYTANIIAGIPRKNSSSNFKNYIIQYRTLLKEDGSGPLREIVNVDQIRPIPSDFPSTEFHLFDPVDVYYNDGWWSGKVSGIIRDKYFVYFPITEEEIAFIIDQMRVHQDWVDGKWVLSKKYEEEFKPREDDERR